MAAFQKDPNRGDFVAFMNRKKVPGDNRPAFEGHLTKPGADDKYPAVLWAHEYTDRKTGEVKIMFSGEIGNPAATAPAADQVAALLTAAQATTSLKEPEAVLRSLRLAPRQVVLFPNGFKHEAPEKDRPDYHGGVNYGDGSSPDQIGAWLKNDRYGRAYLSGNTSHPIFNKDSGRASQDRRDGLDELIGAGQDSRGMRDGRA